MFSSLAAQAIFQQLSSPLWLRFRTLPSSHKLWWELCIISPYYMEQQALVVNHRELRLLLWVGCHLASRPNAVACWEWHTLQFCIEVSLYLPHWCTAAPLEDLVVHDVGLIFGPLFFLVYKLRSNVAKNWEIGFYLIPHLCTLRIWIIKLSIISSDLAQWRSKLLVLLVFVALQWYISVSPSLSKISAANSTKQRWKSLTFSKLQRRPENT